MIFRLRALQRLYRKHEKEYKEWGEVMHSYNQERNLEGVSYCNEKRKNELAHMAKIESLIKLLQ